MSHKTKKRRHLENVFWLKMLNLIGFFVFQCGTTLLQEINVPLVTMEPIFVKFSIGSCCSFSQIGCSIPGASYGGAKGTLSGCSEIIFLYGTRRL